MYLCCDKFKSQNAIIFNIFFFQEISRFSNLEKSLYPLASFDTIGPEGSTGEYLRSTMCVSSQALLGWVHSLFEAFAINLILTTVNIGVILSNFEVGLGIMALGVERTPNLDTSGDRCAKPGPRFSAKVLISRITVYSILTVPFSM